ncbi:hypothetical protein [Corynebacterium glyciniphilum]|uniref:hypothetical protein n=1 Tax=Corynebacterium glyciniphilum TaxID=1404244 RepID=UPI003FD1DB6B
MDKQTALKAVREARFAAQAINRRQETSGDQAAIDTALVLSELTTAVQYLVERADD